MIKKIIAIAALAAGAAHAADIELSVGQTQYQQVANTNWWQAGPASQGFSTDFKLVQAAYSVGLRGDGWRVGYINLGNATADNVATLWDSQYNAQTQSCNPGCQMNHFWGTSQDDGVYATAVHTWGNGLFVEAGAWYYRNHLSITTALVDGSNAPYYMPVQDTYQLGPVVGVGYTAGRASVAATLYQAQRTGQLPALFQGYAGVLSVRYAF